MPLTAGRSKIYGKLDNKDPCRLWQDMHVWRCQIKTMCNHSPNLICYLHFRNTFVCCRLPVQTNHGTLPLCRSRLGSEIWKIMKEFKPEQIHSDGGFWGAVIFKQSLRCGHSIFVKSVEWCKDRHNFLRWDLVINFEPRRNRCGKCW